MNARLLHLAAAPFEAARQLDGLPAGHRAGRPHGHGFIARARAACPVDWGGFRGAASQALRAALAAAVAPLDYRDLNTVLPVPGDEQLARWLRARLAVPGIDTLSIRGARDQGVDLDADGHAHWWRRFRFEAAHRLPRVPADHPCGRMHGHGFEVVLHVDRGRAGEDPGNGFDRIEALWAPLHRELHLSCLNDIPGLDNPTSEILSRWLWQRLAVACPTLSWVTVRETATAGCHYDGARFRIWKAQRFDSALRLDAAPDGSARRRLHGHGYLLRLHLQAPLDRVLGWTVDYGDVKALFRPVLAELDHHCLNDLGPEQATDPGSLTRWIRARAGAALPWLDGIELHETPDCGALLCWGERAPALPSAD